MIEFMFFKFLIKIGVSVKQPTFCKILCHLRGGHIQIWDQNTILKYEVFTANC